MYINNSIHIRPELDQYRTHRWRPMRELLVTIRALENCDFTEAQGRAQARQQIDATYGNGVSSVPIYDVNQRFPARKIMVNITLTPYATMFNNMRSLLQTGDTSNPERCEYLVSHYRGLIREFKRLLEMRVGAYSRDRFEGEFQLEWRE